MGNYSKTPEPDGLAGLVGLVSANQKVALNAKLLEMYEGYPENWSAVRTAVHDAYAMGVADDQLVNVASQVAQEPHGELATALSNREAPAIRQLLGLNQAPDME